MKAIWRFLKLALIALRRDAAAGELRLLGIALMIAVASMASVSFFVDRVRTTLNLEARFLLGADLVIESNDPPRQVHLDRARELGLETARIVEMASVAAAGAALQLTELKAAEAGYPLRGYLEIADEPFGATRRVAEPPPPGEVWVEPRVLQAMGLAVGDSLSLGAAALRITGVIVLEPDRGNQLFTIAPRVLMNHADLEATGLILPGSRLDYELLIAGDEAALDTFRAGLERIPGERLEDVRDVRPEVNRALDRAEQFLSLAALTSVLVAGIAIALSARRFANRHLDTCAVMRTFGVQQNQIIALFGTEVLILGLIASVAGGMLGFAAHLGIVEILTGVTQSTLAPPSLAPIGVATLTGTIGILGFALPPLVGLRTVPPLRVLRRDIKPKAQNHNFLYLAALAAILALAPWGKGNPEVTTVTLAGALGTCAALALGSWLLVRLLRGLRRNVGGPWRYGLASISRRAGGSVLQATAIGLGAMILLLLAVVRNDLLDEWRASLPEDAPNNFLINIQPDDVPQLRAFFAERGTEIPEIYPMVRARVVEVNGEPTRSENYTDPRARRLARREFNLSMAADPASDNRIVAGEWWDGASPGRHQFSFEVEFARELGLEIGDRLTYEVADTRVTGEITSFREVQWDSFNVNFFVIGTPGMLDGLPATYITSFHLDESDRDWLPQIVARFPSVTLIDIDAIMRQVRGIMDRVTLAIELIFGFTVIAGLLVLWSAIQATQDERRYDSAIFKSVGVSHQTLRRAAVAELATLGALAGIIAAVGATLCGGMLARQAFEITYVPDPLLMSCGVLVCIGFVVGGGYLALRHALRQPPITLLRLGA